MTAESSSPLSCSVLVWLGEFMCSFGAFRFCRELYCVGTVQFSTVQYSAGMVQFSEVTSWFLSMFCIVMGYM